MSADEHQGHVSRRSVFRTGSAAGAAALLGSTQPAPAGQAYHEIDVRRFGVLPVERGVADCTEGLLSLRAALRRSNGLQIVYFPAGHYKYTNNRWLQGVRNVHVIGYGAKLECIHNWIYGTDSVVLNLNLDYFNDYLDGPYPDAGAGFVNGDPPIYLIESVDAESEVITLRIPAEASQFVVGDDIVIFGFAIQGGVTAGYPPNARFHELAKVVAVDASRGVLRLELPLTNAYRSDWYPNLEWRPNAEFAMGARHHNAGNVYRVVGRTGGGISGPEPGPTGTGSGIIDGQLVWEYVGSLDDPSAMTQLMRQLQAGACGPAMLVKLRRNETYIGHDGQSYQTSFRLMENCVLEGLEGVTNSVKPSGPPDEERGLGSLRLGGVRNLTLINCRFGNCSPSVCERFEALDCDIVATEVDKILPRVTYDRCRIRKLLGGAGGQVVTVRDCSIYETVNTGGKYWFFNNSDFYSESGGGKAKCAADIAVFDACRFYRRTGEILELFQTEDPITFTVEATPPPTARSIAVRVSRTDFYPLTILAPGFFIFTGEPTDGSQPQAVFDNHGVITDLFRQQDRLIVTADFKKQPSAGDVFNVHITRQLLARNCVDVYANEIVKPVQAFRSYRAQFYKNDAETSHIRKIAIPIPKLPLPPRWVAATSYAVGDQVVVTGEQVIYECVEAGVSGLTGPTGAGAAIADGTVAWKSVRRQFETFFVNGYLRSLEVLITSPGASSGNEADLYAFVQFGQDSWAINAKETGFRSVGPLTVEGTKPGDNLHPTNLVWVQNLIVGFTANPATFPEGWVVAEVVDHL